MKTTYCTALQQAAPDLVGRNFVSEEPDRLWVADITYVRSAEGFVYLAFILDVCTRRVVGWSMATHLRTEIVVDALQMAIARRKPAPGLVHHSDRGVSGRIQSVEATPQTLEVWNGPTEGLDYDDDRPGSDAFAGTPGREP